MKTYNSESVPFTTILRRCQGKEIQDTEQHYLSNTQNIINTTQKREVTKLITAEVQSEEPIVDGIRTRDFHQKPGMFFCARIVSPSKKLVDVNIL